MNNRIQGPVTGIVLTLCLAVPLMQAHAQKPAKRPQKPAVNAPPTKAQLNAALATAVRKRSIDRVVDLLKRGADPNYVSDGSPVLVLAATGGIVTEADPETMMGDRGSVEVLLEAGAKPDAADAKGQTALWKATQNGNAELCGLLLDQHASVDLADKEGVTPLMVATINASSDTVELLLAHHADPNARTPDGLTPLGYLILGGGQGNLVVAFMPGFGGPLKAMIFQKLVAAGADVKAKAKDGTGLLTIAAFKGDLAFARILLDKGADINERSTPGDTPLLAAALEGKVSLARFLLAKGADPNLANSNGLTPLMTAVHKGNFAFVQMLLNKGANASAQAKDGTTALKVADSQKFTALKKLLVAAGAKE